MYATPHSEESDRSMLLDAQTGSGQAHIHGTCANVLVATCHLTVENIPCPLIEV